MNKPELKKTILTNWPKTIKYFDRIHVDYVGPIAGKMFLIITNSFSKWPETFENQKSDTENTLIKLREVFSRFGLPNTIVLGNGAPFTSSEFSSFCQYNGIKHLTSPPYHLASNGAAENAVKLFKLGFKKILSDNKNISTHLALCKFYFTLETLYMLLL